MTDKLETRAAGREECGRWAAACVAAAAIGHRSPSSHLVRHCLQARHWGPGSGAHVRRRSNVQAQRWRGHVHAECRGQSAEGSGSEGPARARRRRPRLVQFALLGCCSSELVPSGTGSGCCSACCYLMLLATQRASRSRLGPPACSARPRAPCCRLRGSGPRRGRAACAAAWPPTCLAGGLAPAPAVAGGQARAGSGRRGALARARRQLIIAVRRRDDVAHLRGTECGMQGCQ